MIIYMADEIRTKVAELMTEESYDMTEEFDEKGVQDLIVYMVLKMQDIPVFCYSKFGYMFKVNNGNWGVTDGTHTAEHGSLISMSNDEETAIEESMYYIHDNGKMLALEDVCKNLLEMINACWYKLNKD